MSNTKEDKAANQLKDLIFTQLDQIYKVCESGAKDYNSKSIPLSYLKMCIDETKKGFNKGFK